MRIFLASSTEAQQSGHLLKVASWIEKRGHTPLPWDSPELFSPGEYTFDTLGVLAREVDAAIFIFSEDDRIWYHGRDSMKQPRDNVLIEYGLFTGVLGKERAIVCRVGSPKMASDLGGLTNVRLDSEIRAEIQIAQWLSNLHRSSLAQNIYHMDSPFQSLGKESLFRQGTMLIKQARRQIALVAKTPIVLVGCRPYDDSQKPKSYEQEQFDEYCSIVERSSTSSLNPLNFVCVSSKPAVLNELETRGGSLPFARVRANHTRLAEAEDRDGSRFRLRWHDDLKPMSFLVADDKFIIWFKDGSGDSVWITAHNETISSALYSRANKIGVRLDPGAVASDFGSAS
ncbi:TIR domain-containing protein [Actinoplanes sp. NPDC049265]|uniref:TIR domain-containing protein n=1 Tax=Actinoplanes sp. NPDC049265 TaxID=3363902 RepID=UPI00372009DB